MKQDNTKKLMEYLISEKNNWIDSESLANYLYISKRQLRNYIFKINSLYGESVIISGKKGYKLIKSDCDRQLISDMVADDSNKRSGIILQKLIFERNGIDISDLADSLFVSDSTIENDLNNVTRYLKKYSLTLERKKHAIYIVGEEQNKRRVVRSLISNNETFDDFDLPGDVRFLVYHYQVWDFRKNITNIFNKNGVFLNDYTLNNIALHSIIMIDRIRNGHEITEKYDICKFKGTLQYSIALQLKEVFENEYKIKINDNELYCLILVVDTNSMLIDYNLVNMPNISEYIDVKYIDITKDLIKKLETNYNLNAFDDEFKAKLTIHISNLFKRAEQNYSINNPLTGKIKIQYPLIFDMAVFVGHELEHTYKIQVSEDEITFLALHIGAYFENNVQSKKRVSVAFIYADYYSMYTSALEKIYNAFKDKIIIKYSVSISNYRPEFIHADLIISLVDIKFFNKYIIVSPFVTDQDIENIKKETKKISREKRLLLIKDNMVKFFKEELFYKNPKFVSKQEALSTMCNRAIEGKFVDKEFYASVLERESLSSTAFDFVAIPHALRNHTNVSFLSVAISKKPFDWDGKLLNMIVMIGLDEENQKLFAEMFDELIEIFSYGENVSKLVNANDYQEFIRLILLMLDI